MAFVADMIRVSWKESVPAVSVQFISAWGLYNAGEQAGFTGPIAASLVDAGVALYLNPPVLSPVIDVEADQALAPKEMTHEDELAALGVETSTKDDSEDEMKRKALKRPPKDKMVKGSQTK